MNKKAILILMLLCTFTRFSIAQEATYGSNIILLVPFSGFGQSLNQIDGHLSMGISYEHILGKQKSLGICIPFYYGQNISDDRSSNILRSIKNHSFLINPGIKFYPFGQQRWNYALGPSVFTAFGSDSRLLGMGGSETSRYRRAGVMVNNYLHFNCNSFFNIGIEVAFGSSLLNKSKTENQSERSLGAGPFVKLGFQAGFRF